MTIQRMDNVLIVVEDLKGAKAFFAELGMELQGEVTNEGEWVDRTIGLEGVRADIDERDETVGKRIRDAEVEKIPKVVVYGDRESAASLAIRDRGGEQYTTSLVDFVRELATL